uniref:Large ribosomal subunit protein uL3c n=1 Tax=Mallomonas splendens TaxID=52552 RepID=A0A3G2QZV1_9STRA|nr:ribosomal protein L3 [Mallomonas splendens]AYO28583.1 ribosomal protein L3 [Mallomonas splendens]
MSLGILGNKIGMTQIFTPKGDRIPVTVIKGGPCYVTQIKSKENCGYNAIQLGYFEISPNSKNITKPNLGHFNKVNLPPFRYLKEYKTLMSSDYEIGQKFSVEMFKIGEKVNISGLTIGKGFTGNIKRHNFERGAITHGSKHHRAQGSLGSGTTPGRVFPGKRMSGHSGVEKRTVLGLEIIDIDINENIIVVKGCIPGKSGNLVNITLKN